MAIDNNGILKARPNITERHENTTKIQKVSNISLSEQLGSIVTSYTSGSKSVKGGNGKLKRGDSHGWVVTYGKRSRDEYVDFLGLKRGPKLRTKHEEKKQANKSHDDWNMLDKPSKKNGKYLLIKCLNGK